MSAAKPPAVEEVASRPAGIVELRVEGEGSSHRRELRHLSASEALSLLEVWCPVTKAVGTLRSMTLVVPDEVQGRVVEALLDVIDVPELTAEDPAREATPDGLFYRGVRRFLMADRDGSVAAYYGDSLKALRASVEGAGADSPWVAYSHLLAAWIHGLTAADPGEQEIEALDAAAAAAGCQEWLQMVVSWRRALAYRRRGDTAAERATLVALCRSHSKLAGWRVYGDAERRLSALATNKPVHDPLGQLPQDSREKAP